MSRASKTLHRIEYTAADGARRFIAAGVVVEPGIIPADELAELARFKAVKLFDPLDRDHDGNRGGSKRSRGGSKLGRRRKVAPTTIVDAAEEPKTVPESPAVGAIEDGLFD